MSQSLGRRSDEPSEGSNEYSQVLVEARSTRGRWAFAARALWWCNIMLGVLLWFFYFTDYSLPGTVPDIVFPLIVALFGLVAISTAGVFARGKSERHWRRIACLPSLVGGLSFLLICCALFVPPLTLGGMFIADSIPSETLTQRANSPNGLLMAEVYTRPG